MHTEGETHKQFNRWLGISGLDLSSIDPYSKLVSDFIHVENQVNKKLKHDSPTRIWKNATQQDLLDPKKYMQIRTQDHENSHRLLESVGYKWYPTGFIPATQEHIYSMLTESTVGGYESEMRVLATREPGELIEADQLFTFRLGFPEMHKAIVYEIQSPTIGSISEKDAYEVGFDNRLEPNTVLEMERIIEAYHDRRERNRSYNPFRIGGGIPSSMIIATANVIGIFSRLDITEIFAPHNLPLRYEKYGRKANRFFDQLHQSLTKTTGKISGFSKLSNNSSKGYAEFSISNKPRSKSKHFQINT